LTIFYDGDKVLNVTRNFLWRLATIIELRRYGRLFLATAEFFVPLSILAVVLRRIDMKPHRAAHGEGPKGSRSCTYNLRSSTGSKCNTLQYVVCLAMVDLSAVKTLQ